MILMETKKKAQVWASRKNIAEIFGYKNPSDLLKNFRELDPEIFHPYKPFVKNTGMDTMYSIICFAYYYENRDLIEAGSRSISFEKELPRLKEIYG